jgi:hypothetical protein
MGMKQFHTTFTKAIVLICYIVQAQFHSQAQNIARQELNFPDIPGFVTLKCDFHTHTVFSDGAVWPSVRITEAWRDGLDAICISDHIEYQPHHKDVNTDHNRSYELALPAAQRMGILLIRGAEITRSMPPGHFNALFIKDASLLAKDDFMEAIQAAAEQGAFIQWNHPCWDAQQPDTVRWFEEHTRLLAKGYLHGIEVINETQYCPEAQRWAVEKNLTITGNSDIHDPIDLFYHSQHIKRPVTLVFAREKTEASLKDALFERRTLVVSGDVYYGDSALLATLVSSSLKASPVMVYGQKEAFITLTNRSPVPLHLQFSNNEISLSPSDLVIPPGTTARLQLNGYANLPAGKLIAVPVHILNAFTLPETSLKYVLKLTLNP